MPTIMVIRAIMDIATVTLLMLTVHIAITQVITTVVTIIITLIMEAIIIVMPLIIMVIQIQTTYLRA